jgi:hypothetical protein
LQVWVLHASQEHVAQRSRDRQGRKTLLGVVLVAFEVHLDQYFEGRVLVRAKSTLFDEDLAEGLRFVQHPSVHRRDERIPAYEIHLQRQNAEQQIAVGARPAGRGSDMV